MSLRDGTLHFDATGDVVGPGMTGDAFMQLRFVKDHGYRSGAYTGDVRLGKQQVDGKPFFVTFHFVKSRLFRVELCLAIETPPGREGWAKETEIERKAAHEAWCAKLLGEPLEVVHGDGVDAMRGRDYAWGSIRSIYDGRAGGSYIRLEYEE